MNVLESRSKVLASLEKYQYVHNYWATTIVQNYYAAN